MANVWEKHVTVEKVREAAGMLFFVHALRCLGQQQNRST